MILELDSYSRKIWQFAQISLKMSVGKNRVTPDSPLTSRLHGEVTREWVQGDTSLETTTIF